MSQNQNSFADINFNPQSSFNLPNISLPDNFFSNFEEITNKYDNNNNNQNNQKYQNISNNNKLILDQNIQKKEDEIEEYNVEDKDLLLSHSAVCEG